MPAEIILNSVDKKLNYIYY